MKCSEENENESVSVGVGVSRTISLAPVSFLVMLVLSSSLLLISIFNVHQHNITQQDCSFALLPEIVLYIFRNVLFILFWHLTFSTLPFLRCEKKVVKSKIFPFVFSLAQFSKKIIFLSFFVITLVPSYKFSAFLTFKKGNETLFYSKRFTDVLSLLFFLLEFCFFLSSCPQKQTKSFLSIIMMALNHPQNDVVILPF